MSPVKKGEVINVFSLGEGGWLFFTGKKDPKNTTKLELRFKLYNPDLQLKWEKPIERKANNYWGKTEIFLSDNYVYHVEFIGKYPSVGEYKNLFITRLAITDGTVETVEMEGVKDNIMNHIGQFVHNDQLCFVQYNFKDNEQAEYHLLNFNWNARQFERKKLELPVIDKSKGTWYDAWIFTGVNDQQLYFYAKELHLNEENENLIYHIRTLNMEGRQQQQFDIKPMLPAGKHFAPSGQNYPENLFVPGGFTFKSKSQGNGIYTYAPSIGSFGSIYFDFKNQEILAHGLYNEADKPYKNSIGSFLLSISQKAAYNGYYIYKYDLGGKGIAGKITPFQAEQTQIDLRLLENFAVDNYCSLNSCSVPNLLIFSIDASNGIGKNMDRYVHDFIINRQTLELLRARTKEYYGDVPPFYNKVYNTEIASTVPEQEILIKLYDTEEKRRKMIYKLWECPQGFLLGTNKFGEKQYDYKYIKK